MGALAADRNVPCKELGRMISLRVKANVVIYKGSVVAVDATGYAKAAADAANEIPIGVAADAANNTGGADAAIRVKVLKGVFGMVNAGTAVDVADVGGPVYVLTDNEVSKVAGVTNNIVMGTVDDHADQDDSLVYVKFHEHG